MIVVTGTKRSGTSAWMQILRAMGLPVIGEQFPRNWEQTIKDANPHGFYESQLLGGVYYRTNPHPMTGDYLFPEQTQAHAVKIFASGLVRTGVAFIDRCLATVRPWQEYDASLRKLQSLSMAARGLDDSRGQNAILEPALEWWLDNFLIIRDVAMRRYPVHMQSYAGLLRDPERVIADVRDWIGTGDPSAGAAAVDRTLYRNKAATARVNAPDVPDGVLDVFDELYGAIDRGETLSPSFVEKINETNERLIPLFVEHQAALKEDIASRVLGRPVSTLAS